VLEGSLLAVEVVAPQLLSVAAKVVALGTAESITAPQWCTAGLSVLLLVALIVAAKSLFLALLGDEALRAGERVAGGSLDAALVTVLRDIAHSVGTPSIGMMKVLLVDVAFGTGHRRAVTGLGTAGVPVRLEAFWIRAPDVLRVHLLFVVSWADEGGAFAPLATAGVQVRIGAWVGGTGSAQALVLMDPHAWALVTPTGGHQLTAEARVLVVRISRLITARM